MSVSRISGSNSCTTSQVITYADADTCDVVIEGAQSFISGITNFSSYVPEDYTLESRTVTTENGFGKVALHCKKYDTGETISPVRTTFRISMAETTYELKDHPYLTAYAAVARFVTLWLATDEAQRVTVDDSGTVSYFYSEGEELKPLDNATAIKFCRSYMNGVRNFVRYFPVVEKISILKNPQGVTMSENSYTGGSFTFADDIGKYDSPPVTLAGYDSDKWFKSRDDYVQNEDRTWTRTEQWTFTPESSSGDHAWIYTEI